MSINALFSALVAVCLCMGLLFARAETAQPTLRSLRLGTLVPLTAFCWLLIPLGLSGDAKPVARVRELHAAEQLWKREVSGLRAQQCEALCESLLACYQAGKPYVYDPYNATRLIAMHRLDQSWILQQLADHRIKVIQTNGLLATGDRVQHERFAPDIRAAIQAHYAPVELNARGAVEGLPVEQQPVLYLPKPAEP